MKIYLKILAVAYFAGGMLHIADVLDLRLKFSEMGPLWRVWIIYLLIFDLMAAVGLLRGYIWGEITFVIVAISQLIAYLFFQEFFGQQTFLVVFHFVTVLSYAILKIKCKRTYEA